jgi:hypothetical protein
MSTQQSFLVCDSSTLANFKSWGQTISAFFSTATWTQSTDTGQVNWSTISSVPGSGAFVYEVWQPNDGLTTFYVKMEYGNVSGTNCPSLRITISSATDGAGDPTGFVLGPVNVNQATFTPPSTTTQYECDFSGAAGRIGAMMWRNGINGCQQLFAIERSINSGGSYTSAHVTLWTSGWANSGGKGCFQGSLVFGVGVAPNAIATSNVGGWIVRQQILGGATTAFNGGIPLDTCAPCVGFFDFPCTVAGTANASDIVEGVTFNAILYGSTRTYMPSKNGTFAQVCPSNLASATSTAVCMRYD